MLSWIRQIVSISSLSLRTLKERLDSSFVAMFGIAGVVGVLVAVLSIAEGFQATMRGSGADDTAIVLRSGSDSEMTSGLGLEETRIIADAPGVRRTDSGPLASAELFVIINLDKRSTGTEANVPLRGVQMAAFDVREELRIVAGRKFEPGRNEILVGEGAQREFAGLDLGSKLRLGQTDWEVVGVFSTGGTVADSELWSDVKVLQPAYRRGESFQSVYVKLESPGSFKTFQDALTTDERLNVKVMRETDYYSEQSTLITAMIKTLGSTIAFLMAIGAVFGALNTIYSAVASRAREIATLRALGFSRLPVVFSVMVESLLLALLGGLVGGILAYFAFNGYQTATINWQSFSQVTFAFAVTPSLVIRGIVWALVMGFIGGLPPAIRAAFLPVATALRES